MAGLLLAAGLGIGCGDTTSGVAQPPSSPVGTCRYEAYWRGIEIRGGVPVPRFEWVRTVRIRIAADHSITYEWATPNKSTPPAGRLVATWREATAGERAAENMPFPRWWVVEPNGVDRKRGPDDPLRTLMWEASAWYVPEVDVATGRLTDACWGLQRTDG